MLTSYITMLGTGNTLATRCYNTCFTMHDPSGEILRFCRGCPAVAFGYTHNFYTPDPQCWKEV